MSLQERRDTGQTILNKNQGEYNEYRLPMKPSTSLRSFSQAVTSYHTSIQGGVVLDWIQSPCFSHLNAQLLTCNKNL